MKWRRIRKRDADVERELQSDLELEEEEQREGGLSREEARHAAYALSAIARLFARKLVLSGVGPGWRALFAM